MTKRLSKEDRVFLHQVKMRFPTLDDMLKALNLKGQWFKHISNGPYAPDDPTYKNANWRECTISKRGFLLVEYYQHRDGECLIKKLFKVKPQFLYDVTPTKPQFDGVHWTVGIDPKIEFVGSRTNRYELLDLTYNGIHHCFPNKNTTPLQAYKVRRRIEKAVKRFADAASIMFGWLDCPKGITGKEWHRLHWHFKR